VARVDILPGGLLRALKGRRSGFTTKNKKLNKLNNRNKDWVIRFLAQAYILLIGELSRGVLVVDMDMHVLK